MDKMTGCRSAWVPLVSLLFVACAASSSEGDTTVQPAYSTPAPVTVLTYAIAVDPGVPYPLALIEEAVQSGLERWMVPGTSLVAHSQGTSDMAVLENDGLQVIWLWWYSQAFPADEQAWMVQLIHERRDRGIGFDLVLQGPRCPGLGSDDDEAVFNALSNAVAQGVGLGLALPPSLDGEGLLAQTQCRSEELIYPSEQELEALRRLYPAIP